MIRSNTTELDGLGFRGSVPLSDALAFIGSLSLSRPGPEARQLVLGRTTGTLLGHIRRRAWARCTDRTVHECLVPRAAGMAKRMKTVKKKREKGKS